MMAQQGPHMPHTKVVHLAEIKDLLAQLEVIRQHVLKGKVAGWFGTLRDEDGTETVYMGGVHARSSEDRLKAILKMSAARLQQSGMPMDGTHH